MLSNVLIRTTSRHLHNCRQTPFSLFWPSILNFNFSEVQKLPSWKLPRVFFFPYYYCIPSLFFCSWSMMMTRSVIWFSKSPSITFENLNGKIYLSWIAAIEMWFLGQGHHDHLEQDESHVPAKKVEPWNQANFQLCPLVVNFILTNRLMNIGWMNECKSQFRF